jgi:cysteine desulfurase
MRARIYVDHATTTPLDERVRAAMLPFLNVEYGSPASPHARGRRLRDAVEAARSQVAALLGADPDEILFTGSATEANNLALKGTILAARSGARVLAAATEHISVLHPLRTLERAGATVRLMPVDGNGLLDPDRLRDELRNGGTLVAVAHASAEIGTLQPIADLTGVARDAGVPFHCDATASAGLVATGAPGHLPDLVTVAPHLFGGPQGIAALRVARGHSLRPLVEGGTQEGGLRAGTQSVAAIVGFAAAARLALAEREERVKRATALAGDLRRRIHAALAPVVFTGHAVHRLPGHVSLCVEGAEAEALLRELDEAGVEASSGSPCATGAGKPSHVLEAIGIPAPLARGALTVMFGTANRPGDPQAVAGALAAAAARLRALSPLAGRD